MNFSNVILVNGIQLIPNQWCLINVYFLRVGNCLPKIWGIIGPKA